jgi:glycosyltransferase involved in cell wall biosynthesis
MNSSEDERSRRRHCMVVHAYYPLGETRVEREAQALVAQGTAVDLICPRTPGQPARADVDGVEVYRLPVRRHDGGLAVQLLEYLSFFILAFFRLTSLHLQRHYDVVQVHNLPDFLVFVALIPRLTGARVIIDLHDLMPEFYAERHERSMDSLPVRLIRWQEWLSCRFADHVITVTELWRQTLIRRGQPADKVTVVMNVADDRVFHLDAAADVDRRDGRFCLVYHGIMGRRHGLDLALRAVDQVRHAVPSIHLLLHGGGEYLPALESLASELGLQDYVQFSTHFIPTAELPALLQRADLAVVPYRNGVFSGEILPTKLMEYAALGIPAIASRTPAVAAYFDETNVQFFTPGDVDELAQCILTLYRDRTRLAELARNITGFNERYNWAKQRAVYLQLVDRLVEGRG